MGTRSRSPRASTPRRSSCSSCTGSRTRSSGLGTAAPACSARRAPSSGRLPALRRFAKPRAFDLALAHGSHELTLAARSLGIPSATAHDYEFATLQHQLGLRAATRVVFPDAIPADRLARLGAKPPKLVRYPGIEEEYYLADFEPDPAVLDGIDPAKVLAVVRTPPDVSLYHRHGNPLFAGVLERLGRDESVHAVVLPRTAEQREAIRGFGLPSLHVPERAVDAPSLVALADLTVSAGGTMNREAAALGTPAYTTFTGRRRGGRRAADRRRVDCARSLRRRARRPQARHRCASASGAIRGSCSIFSWSRFRYVQAGARCKTRGNLHLSDTFQSTFCGGGERHESFT